MLLAIDCGNTNTVFSIWDGEQFLATWRTSTEWQRTADQYYEWLSSLMRFQNMDVHIDEVIVSSTVPRVVFNLRVFADRYYNCRPLVVGKPDCLLPAAPRVDEGTQVGPDRLVNAAGAFDRHGGDLIVVDFGTATTFDVVASDGAYVGGVIAPGVNLSLEALHNAAAALPHVDITKPQKVIGTNTVECMQSGVFWGYVNLIDGRVRQVKDEYKADLTVVATGGVASLFEGASDTIDHFDQSLMEVGLLEVHNRNLKT